MHRSVPMMPTVSKNNQSNPKQSEATRSYVFVEFGDDAQKNVLRVASGFAREHLAAHESDLGAATWIRQDNSFEEWMAVAVKTAETALADKMGLHCGTLTQNVMCIGASMALWMTASQIATHACSRTYAHLHVHAPATLNSERSSPSPVPAAGTRLA